MPENSGELENCKEWTGYAFTEQLANKTPCPFGTKSNTPFYLRK